MGTLTMETVRPEVGVRAAKTSPVIVATDGRDQSDAALVAGGLLAGSTGGLRVVTVLKPMPIVSPEAQIPISPDVEASAAFYRALFGWEINELEGSGGQYWSITNAGRRNAGIPDCRGVLGLTPHGTVPYIARLRMAE